MDKSSRNKRCIIGFLIVLFSGACFGDLGDFDIIGDFILSGDEKKIYWYNGSNYWSLRANSSLATNIEWLWPADAGTGGQALLTDGTNVLSWGTSSTSAAHNLLSPTHSDTTTQSPTRGSLIYGNSTPAWDELTLGASGTILRSDGTDVSWTAFGAVLDDLNTLGAPSADGEFLVATGAGVFAYETLDTARTSLGLGTGDSPTWAGATFTNAAVIGSDSVVLQPNADAADFFQVKDAAGASVLIGDTTNRKVSVGIELDIGGHTIIQQAGDNRVHGISDDNPHLRVYSSDAEQANDYIEVFHDKVLGRIRSLTNLVINGRDVFLDATNFGFVYSLNATDCWAILVSTAQDWFHFVLHDASGNQAVITNRTNSLSDHKHPVQIDPTVFIHSDTNPNDYDDQWLSFCHNKTNAIFGIGTGYFEFGGNLVTKNFTHSDADGAGATSWTTKRERSGGEEADIFSITGSHDGIGDDQFGKIIASVNTGAGLVQALEIGSDLLATFAGNINAPSAIYNSVILTGADASPDASGEIQYDSTISGMSGGGLRWYDDDSVRLLVDLETDPSNDDYVVTYDSAADGFYMSAAGTGDVTGPGSSVDNEIVRFDSTTGKIVQAYTSGGPTISDTGEVAITVSLNIPNGTDPDVDAAGEITNDTDGADETGDVIIRGFDGTNQFPVGRKLKTLSFTLIEPDQIDAYDLIPVWHNTSGMTFTIVEWKAWSDDDDVSFEIEELTDMTDFTAITQVDACEVATDGTSVFYGSDTTITHAAIEHDHSIAIDFDGANDTPDYVQICIIGWYNADVD